ncbi:MAG: aminoglycoside phosphotransferase family protein [Myxococcota bacterium]
MHEFADSPETARALAAYPGLSAPRVALLPSGLIHRSFAVRDGPDEFVLQRVNPIFSPLIHENIAAVTEHLAAKGLVTLRLLPTATGALCADLGSEGLWRLMTRVPGVSFDTCDSPGQAHAAGALLARFHSALDDLEHEFRPLGIPLHDTPAHLEALEAALAEHPRHPLHDAVATIAEQALGEARAWESLDGLPARVIHGDLKFSNVLFAAGAPLARSRAVSLIDLDTLSRLPLYAELGDAWRSWCNRRGEDAAVAEFDAEIFRASAQGYLGALAIPLDEAERHSLALGLERIALELCARFAADALRETYFAWDRRRFASAGDHNLTRARGQLSLYRQARAQRQERIDLLLAGREP